MMSCISMEERLIEDLEDWDLVETEDIGGVDSVLATTAIDLLQR